MNIDAIAFEISPGVFMVPDRLLRAMKNDPDLLGYTVYHPSEADVACEWVRLLEACPDIHEFSLQEKEELRRRLFTPLHIFLVGSSMGSEGFRSHLDHEWFHKLCLANPDQRHLLFEAYKEIFSHHGLNFTAMGFFSKSLYGRFPPFDEFWAQWFRPSLFGGDGPGLELWEIFKDEVRSMQSETVTRAVDYVEHLSHRVNHEVLTLYSAIQQGVARYRGIRKELNIEDDSHETRNENPLEQRLVIQGVNMRFEWDQEKDKDTGPIVTFGSKRISWMCFHDLDLSIKCLRLCIEQFAAESEQQQRTIAAMMIANANEIIKAVDIWTRSETFEYTFQIGTYTRYFLNASKDPEEQTYWCCRVIEKLDKLYHLLELEKIVWETVPYHDQFWAPYYKASLRQYLNSLDESD